MSMHDIAGYKIVLKHVLWLYADDSTRVVLHDKDSDYINASWIDVSYALKLL